MSYDGERTRGEHLGLNGHRNVCFRVTSPSSESLVASCLILALSGSSVTQYLYPPQPSAANYYVPKGQDGLPLLKDVTPVLLALKYMVG